MSVESLAFLGLGPVVVVAVSFYSRNYISLKPPLNHRDSVFE